MIPQCHKTKEIWSIQESKESHWILELDELHDKIWKMPPDLIRNPDAHICFHIPHARLHCRYRVSGLTFTWSTSGTLFQPYRQMCCQGSDGKHRKTNNHFSCSRPILRLVWRRQCRGRKEWIIGGIVEGWREEACEWAMKRGKEGEISEQLAWQYCTWINLSANAALSYNTTREEEEKRKESIQREERKGWKQGQKEQGKGKKQRIR